MGTHAELRRLLELLASFPTTEAADRRRRLQVLSDFRFRFLQLCICPAVCCSCMCWV